MTHPSASSHAVVLGGGLAGLTAALRLRRQGHDVTVVDKSTTFGGRARMDNVDGALLHRGPRALYKAGPAYAALAELGVDIVGRSPPLAGALGVYGGADDPFDVEPLPFSPWAMLHARLRPTTLWRFRRAQQAGLRAQLDDDVCFVDWVEDVTDDELVRQMLRWIGRLTTYAHLRKARANAVLAQMALANKGVLYVDDGWQGLVVQLLHRCEEAGVVLRSGQRVHRVDDASDGFAVDLGDVQLSADAVVVAMPPSAAASWHPSLATPSLTSARAACLDVILQRDKRHPPSAFGLQLPLYASVHTRAARLAPAGVDVVHLAAYLDVDDKGVECRGLLQGLCAQLFPDANVRHQRFLPEMTVMEGFPVVGGARPVVQTSTPGLAWATAAAQSTRHPHSLLLDAALAAAGEAADHVDAHLRSRHQRQVA